MAQPRVQKGIGHVHDQIHGREYRGEEDHDSLDQRQIAVDDGIDGHVAKPLIREQPFDDDGAADQERELHPDQRQRRQDGIGQRLARDDVVFAIALGARQRHIVQMHGLFQRLLQQLPDDRRQRDGQRQRGHEHVADDVGPKVEPQAQDALEQIEIGGERQIKAGRHPPRDVEHRPQNPEQQDQDQPPQEIGHRQRHAIAHIDRGLDIGSALARAGQRKEPPDEDRNHQRHDRQLQRGRKPPQNQPQNRLVRSDRHAEIALQHALTPDQELLGDRLVQAIKRGQAGDVLIGRTGRQHHGDRVAGHDPDHEEDDHRNPDQGHGRGHKAHEKSA